MNPKNEKLAIQLRSVPQQVILAMTGMTQSIQLRRLSDRWNIPLAGRTVDLFAVLRATCDFLDKHGPILSLILEEGTDDPDAPLTIELLKAKIRKLDADGKLAELRLAQKEGLFCPVDRIHTAIEMLIGRFQRAAEIAQRKWSEEGFRFVDEIAKGFSEDVRPILAALPVESKDVS